MNNKNLIVKLAQKANSYNQKGLYFEAKNVYLDLLKLIPEDLNLLNTLGLLSMQLIDLKDALIFFKKSLEINSNQPNIFYNQALAYKKIGNFPLALESYSQAIKLKPDFFEAYFNYANLLKDLNFFKDALINYEIACKLNPGFIDTYNNWGSVLVELCEFDKANQIFKEALKIESNNIKVLLNLAKNLKNLKNFSEAQKIYEHLISLSPNNSEIWLGKGSLLIEDGNLNEAIYCFNKAIDIRPDYPEAYLNKATILGWLNQFDEALKFFDFALQLKPNYSDVFNNRGLLFLDRKNYEDAINNFDYALQLEPSNANSYFNKAEAYLSIGRYKEGWEMYEWRWKTQHRLKDKNNIEIFIPKNLDDLLGGNKSVLITPEVGFGDFIMFSRYIEMLNVNKLKIFIQTPKELKELFVFTFEGLASVITEEYSPVTDFILPIMSLPRLFKTNIENIPNKFPYLKVPISSRGKWINHVKQSQRFKIGIIWSGKIRGIDRSKLNCRSIDIEYILPILSLPFDFYSLNNQLSQKDREFFSQNNFKNFFEFKIEDFSDTAAIIDLVDLVITIDTSVAHLAAAIGKACWVILPYKSDYRWAQGERTPWYPSVKIFRKSLNDDWAEPIALVIHEMKKKFKL